MVSIRGEKRVDLGESVVARYEKDGQRFEILVDPDKAWRLKQGENIDIRDILIGFIIFEDAKRGRKAQEETLIKTFGTDDVFEIAKKILSEGELQLTTEQRRKIIEDKLKQIVHIISRNGINPQTNQPHPPERIRKAIEKAKVSIDPFKPAEDQVNYVVDAIRAILPIRLEVLKLEVVIPAQFAGKGYSFVIQQSRILREEWLQNGSWRGEIEMPAGLYSSFLAKLNKITNSKAMVKVIERI